VFYNSLGHAAHSTIFGLYMLLGLCSGTVGMVSSSMVKMFPAPVRFSGISFSYNLSYAIVGGMTLPLVHWLSQYSDIGAMYYIFALTILAFVTAFVFWNKFEKNRY
ncbi:MFS transporter, partial [Acinetobacter baumannii]